MASHGVRKVKTSDEKKAEALKTSLEQAKRASKLQAEFQRLRRDEVYTAEALKQCEQLLLLNSELYTVWNFRRRCVLRLLDEAKDDAAALVASELGVAKRGIQANIKSYWSWFHRRWLLCEAKARGVPVQWAHERALCDKLLEVDARNFHCWSYRRFVIAHMMEAGEAVDELAVARALIERNFSNYSAWHERSLSLPERYGGGGDSGREAVTRGHSELQSERSRQLYPYRYVQPSPESLDHEVVRRVLNEEIDLLESAVWCDAGDQSAWLYLRWVMHHSLELMPDDRTVVARVAAICEELNGEGERGKWTLLCLVWAKQLLGDDVKALIDELCTVDERHIEYYKSLLK